MIDENEFFRNVTLADCAPSRDRGRAAVLPRVSLTAHPGGRPLPRTLRSANSTPCESLCAPPPNGRKGRHPDPIRRGRPRRHGARRAKCGAPASLPPVLVINNPRKEPVTRCILEALGIPPSSAMSLPLVIEEQMVGALALIAEGDDRFDEHHVRLYATLKEPFFVAMSNTLKHEEVLRLRDRLADDNRYLNRELLRISGDEIVGADFGLRDVMRQIRQVAPTESPVLLSGETGVGKDVIANAIHLGSPRRDGPFIAVNCGAIPDSPARQRALRPREGRVHRRTGQETRPLRAGRRRHHPARRDRRDAARRPRCGCCGCCSTARSSAWAAPSDPGGHPDHRRHQQGPARRWCEDGRFREDLWFRLNVFPIVVPPLRDRTSDIPALVQHFVERKAAELKFGESPTSRARRHRRPAAYHWPGNVRELENLIERSMILHRGEPLSFDDLQAPRHPTPVPQPFDDQPLDLDTATARHIRRVLEMTGGKIHGPGGAGELLGVNPNTLRSKMKRLGIPFPKRLQS